MKRRGLLCAAVWMIILAGSGLAAAANDSACVSCHQTLGGN